MIVTRALPEDLGAIVGLEEAFPVRDRWSEASWSEELEGPGRLTVVARDGDRLVGVIVLRSGDDVTDLQRIVVAADLRRRGTGDLLMRAALEQATTRVLLEVRDDNEPAQRLYRKHGFVTIHRRVDYYGAGVDALIMERPPMTRRCE
jgi:[ribosomal protein S18]-alanine N-acetyltransferase